MTSLFVTQCDFLDFTLFSYHQVRVADRTSLIAKPLKVHRRTLRTDSHIHRSPVIESVEENWYSSYPVIVDSGL